MNLSLIFFMRMFSLRLHELLYAFPASPYGALTFPAVAPKKQSDGSQIKGTVPFTRLS